LRYDRIAHTKKEIGSNKILFGWQLSNCYPAGYATDINEEHLNHGSQDVPRWNETQRKLDLMQKSLKFRLYRTQVIAML
jgi:hypothetical protein